MDNVVEFKRKEDIFILGFMMPEVINMNKKGDENITLEAKDGKVMPGLSLRIKPKPRKS